MGIKGLTSLIKKESPDSIETTSLYKLSGKKFAIDTSIFLYKSLANVRNNGEYLRNKDGKVVSHVIGLFNKTIQYLLNNLSIIEIFSSSSLSSSSGITYVSSNSSKFLSGITIGLLLI